MNKNIVTWLVIIVVIAIGGYAAYRFLGSGSVDTPATDQSASAAAATASADEVQAQEIVVGTGETAAPGSRVAVLYTGKLTDGTTFDSSAAHNNQPLAFVLGTQDMIPGFQIGVNGMKVGGKRIMSIPPALGYGDQPVTDPQTGNVIIPANSTLLFEVELVAVEAAAPGATQ